jgi:hypothetical protein
VYPVRNIIFLVTIAVPVSVAATNFSDSGLTQPGGPHPTPQEVANRTAPDDDCLFNPSLAKCAPVAGKCPPGFLMNEDEQCFPDKPCPAGFAKPDADETGKCYPDNHLPTPSLSARDNGSSGSVS